MNNCCECCGDDQELELSEGGGVWQCGCSDEICDTCYRCEFCCDCDD